jgi:hypothetical protein
LKVLTGIEPERPPRKDPFLEAWLAGYDQGSFRVCEWRRPGIRQGKANVIHQRNWAMIDPVALTTLSIPAFRGLHGSHHH